MALVQSPKECLVCLNSSETLFVSLEECQKIFNICCSYVKDAINIEFLINNINGNNNQLSFCKNCFHSSLQISQLVEQLSKLKEQIGDLASCFSETIEKRRIQAIEANTQTIQFNDVHAKFQVANNERAHMDSLNRRALNDAQINNEVKNSFIHSEVSNEFIVEVAVDKDGSKIVKTESYGIFLDYIDESGTDNMSGYPEEELDTNSLTTENEYEIDPFGGIPDVITTEKDATFHSTKTYHHEDRGVYFSNNLPVANGPICNSTNITTSVRHRTNKLGNKQYNCFVCEKVFSASSDLKRHSLTHTGEKPYKCSVCEKSYRQSTHLKIHERTHTGEKPYKCSLCERSFHEYGALKYHRTTHSKVKPYKCSYCNVAFKLSLSLKEHQSTHTGETPSNCSFCELKFKTTRARLRHQKKVHSNMN